MGAGRRRGMGLQFVELIANRDNTASQASDPRQWRAFGRNEDYDATNLEHIVPMNPGSNWGLSADEASSAQSLIGNLTLLSTKKNVALGNAPFGNAPFPEKVKIYKDSAYTVTNTWKNTA
jgi:hypothetical protein